MSTRLSGDRVSRLLDRPNSGHLAAILDQFSDEKLKALRTYAVVNLEQAVSAFRITIVGNFSIPIIMLSVAHQLTDGGVLKLFEFIHQGDIVAIIFLIVSGIFMLILLFLVLVYALASLNQARDIRHLIDLFAADRGVYFGLEDSGDLSTL